MRPLRFPFIVLVTLTARVASAANTQEDDEADNFREDVFACEEAVAHLESCCAALDGESIRCVHDRHRTDGCDTYTRYHEDPAISFDEADCVLAMPCAQIRERGICERAARMQPERSSTYHDVGHDEQPVSQGSNAEPLCP